ncbi:MAG: peptidase M23 [Bacteroidia bacterium]|nr:peptidase M23 [Bacteroidia bacterium]
MKKSILTIAAITSIALMSCGTKAEKVENAEEKLIEANQDLNKANEDYLTEVEAYKKETAEKIAANEQSIAEFKLRVENEKKEAKEDYKKRIAELEQKNSDMKKVIDEYQAEGKDKWESFKTEFNHDMEELGQAFKDLGKNKVK